MKKYFEGGVDTGSQSRKRGVKMLVDPPAAAAILRDRRC